MKGGCSRLSGSYVASEKIDIIPYSEDATIAFAQKIAGACESHAANYIDPETAPKSSSRIPPSFPWRSARARNGSPGQQTDRLECGHQERRRKSARTRGVMAALRRWARRCPSWVGHGTEDRSRRLRLPALARSKSLRDMTPEQLMEIPGIKGEDGERFSWPSRLLFQSLEAAATAAEIGGEAAEGHRDRVR